MMSRMRKSLPGLLVALVGVGMAWWIVNNGWFIAIAVVAAGAGAGAIFFRLGKSKLPRDPVGAMRLMEWSGLSPFFITSAVAALVIWIGIHLAPGESASAEDKELLAGLSGALTAFLGAAFVKASEDTDTNWVASEAKSAFKEAYKERFPSSSDGWRAIHSEIQGIDGWVGRTARADRAQLVSTALRERDAEKENG